MPNSEPLDVPDQIRKLAELRDAGVLTGAEFDAKKAELLARDWSSGSLRSQSPGPPAQSSGGSVQPQPVPTPAKKKGNPVVGCLSLIVLLVLAGFAYNSLKGSTTGGGTSGGLDLGNIGGGSTGTITGTKGQPVTVNGVQLTMLDATYAAKLEFQDPPAGSIYVAFKFSVKAVSDQHFVGINNFTVAADGTQQGQFGFVVNSSWEPLLALDQVNPGNTITGWIVYTVPRPSSYVLLTYKDNLFSGGSDAQWRVGCCQ